MDSNQRPKSTWAQSIESFQAKYNEKRKLSERLADYVTLKSGTIAFLVMNCAAFIVWIGFNTKTLPGPQPFDPFPFPLLTTFLSIEAIVLAIFVLISQNRQMKMQDLRQEINLQIDRIAEEEITKLINLVQGLYRALNLDMPADPEARKMAQPTDTKMIEETLKQEIDPESV